jgi:hypothetical protein
LKAFFCVCNCGNYFQRKHLPLTVNPTKGVLGNLHSPMIHRRENDAFDTAFKRLRFNPGCGLPPVFKYNQTRRIS